MSRAAPLRFVGGVVMAWIVGRALVLERPALMLVTPAQAEVPLLPLPAAAGQLPAAPRVPLPMVRGRAIIVAGKGIVRGAPSFDARMTVLIAALAGAERDGTVRLASSPSAGSSDRLVPGDRAAAPIGTASGLDGGPLLSAAPASLAGPASRWSGEAYVFARGGSGGGGDATGGTLGGSQAAARIVYRLDDNGRLALFARGYAPLRGAGAEASMGVEAHPLPGVPLRLAVERRQRVDRAGRSAWEASAAGGVDAKPLPGGLRLDAYAQAGVVGARRGDLFADGSVRVGKPLPLAAGTLTVGAGAWGAAQPDVARLDVGPQAALRLPEGRAALTLAIDWRLRVAGDARPKSGPALTLAADF